MNIRKMKKGILLICIVLQSMAAFAQEKNPVLMTVGDSEVTKSEFEQIFFKNYKKETVSKEDLDEYMELFIKFKLKVAEAEARGMDTVGSFKLELLGYRKQLARPYMVDKEMNESLMQEAYQRMQKEVRASHIMIKCAENAHPEDTLIAFNKALAIRKKLVDGENFERLAKSKGGSEDPSAQENGGDLGFFPVFKMVYPFESAAFDMKVGEISQPVRSKYGYHIIKKTDEREARGQIKVAHIMVAANRIDGEQSDAAKKKIDELYELVTTGTDFASTARKYSNDSRSSANGGVLQMFGSGDMVAEFEEAAFGLKNDGDISKPVQTDFGWHIIKRIEYKPVGSFEETKTFIEAKVKRDVRSNKSKDSFMDKLKKEYNFKDYSAQRFKKLYKQVDTTIFSGDWAGDNVTDLDKPLFDFAGTTYTVGDFKKYLIDKQRNERFQPVHSYLDSKYDYYVTGIITEYEDSRLEEKYPEFKALMKEYRDGILLFEITDEMVWGKAQKDSTGLAKFYEANKTDFMWGDRVEGDIYKCKDAKTAKKIQKLIKKGIERDSIVRLINAESQLNVDAEGGMFLVEDKPELKNVNKGVNGPIEMENSFYIINARDVRAPEPKTLQEARGPIISKYQEYLEKNWIDQLKKKYPVTINEKVLYSIKK